LQEYEKAISAESWFSGLPAKVIRFSFFGLTALKLEALFSSVGAAAGLALNAADQFLLDKLMEGWKPSQFIEGPLSQFVQPKD
jgi:hypothetical protein